jgi:uncharacterized protein (TIGR03435 family)
MNAVRILSSQPWVERLGWTLLHFLWQGLLIAAFYAAARRILRAGPDARYFAACLALAAMLAAPIATFIYLVPDAEPATPPDATARILHMDAQPMSSVGLMPAYALSGQTGEWMTRAVPWIVAIWLLGAALFWLRLAGGLWMTARMRSRQIRSAPPEWQQTLARLCARLRLSRAVGLLVSGRIDVPMVVGWIRPVVLVPLGALSGLPTEQVEALLLHELAHIRRHDYLVNVLQSSAEALLFYHPAVWWVSAHIRAERELCCDDLAVAATGDPVLYAIALAGLEGCRPVHAQSSLAANGGRLAERIARLLGQSAPESPMFSAPAAAAIAGLLALTACALFGQSAERAKFEVASVKESPKLMSYSTLRALPGGRLHIENLTARQLMMSAYGLQDFQIVGGPEWIRGEGFDIEAKGPANGTREQLMRMLQPLMEDRFQLKYHRETRELPVLALTVLHGGAKLPAPKDGGCAKLDAQTPAPAPGGPQPPCGTIFTGFADSGMKARGGDLAMPEFTRFLASTLRRPVIDQTGITAHFDLQLNFAVDDSLAGMADGGAVAGHQESMAHAAAQSAGGPNLLEAIQGQLGLKLVSMKGPVEVIVIDRVEKPLGN